MTSEAKWHSQLNKIPFTNHDSCGFGGSPISHGIYKNFLLKSLMGKLNFQKGTKSPSSQKGEPETTTVRLKRTMILATH